MRPVKVKATALLKDGFALGLAEVGCRCAALSSREKFCGAGWSTKNEKIGGCCCCAWKRWVGPVVEKS